MSRRSPRNQGDGYEVGFESEMQKNATTNTRD